MRAEGWDWRKAAYIAWSVMPSHRRLPHTLKQLATDVLGLSSASSVRKWREKYPEIEDQIEVSRVRVLSDEVPDVLYAWSTMAKTLDPSAHRDRITFLEHAGVYKREKTVAVTGADGGPIRHASDFSEIENEELENLIANSQTET